MDNCRWCGSGVFQADTNCQQCGAPIQRNSKPRDSYGEWIKKMEEDGCCVRGGIGNSLLFTYKHSPNKEDIYG
jgi:hypothetical protein